MTQLFLGRKENVGFIVLLTLLRHAPGDLRAQQPVAAIGAGHQRGVGLAARDAGACLADQGLLKHAYGGEHRGRTGCPYGSGNRARRIAVGPAAARHGDPLRARKRSGARGLPASRLDRFLHQVQWFQRLLEILLAPCGDAYADQDRRARRKLPAHLNRSPAAPTADSSCFA